MIKIFHIEVVLEIIITSLAKEVMFTLAKEVMFLVALVCLFVCLLVDNITQKVINGLG